MVEKPITIRSADAQGLARLARRQQRVLMMASNSATCPTS
jgi:predicted dehydrogenase